MPDVGIPMLEIGRPDGRLVFDMEIAVPGWGGLCVGTAPWALCYSLRHVAWALSRPMAARLSSEGCAAIG